MVWEGVVISQVNCHRCCWGQVVGKTDDVKDLVVALIIPTKVKSCLAVAQNVNEIIPLMAKWATAGFSSPTSGGWSYVKGCCGLC